MAKKINNQTYRFDHPPSILSTGTVAGPMEGEGPCGHDFDIVYHDLTLNENSFEAAERSMMLAACNLALGKIGLNAQNLDLFMAGDLLNQIVTSSFTAKSIGVPYLGIYNACSSSAEGLLLSSFLMDTGAFDKIALAVASHFASSERQYRYPTEYGLKRKPFQQRTVTGSGCAIIGKEGPGPKITMGTIGIVQDFGQIDPLNMGAAMAPAAALTIAAHFEDTGSSPEDYDLIVTGDLRQFGHSLCKDLLEKEGFSMPDSFNDCGMLVYDIHTQNVNSGGSGCGCSAIVTFSQLYKKLKDKEINRLFLVATGALHSPTTVQQGENIPCIAHGVVIENIEETPIKGGTPPCK